jgi:hypothetical protein
MHHSPVGARYAAAKGIDLLVSVAALVAMLEPMKLTPSEEAGGSFDEAEAKIQIPANQEVSRKVLSKTGCGGPQGRPQQSPSPVFTGPLVRYRGAVPLAAGSAWRGPPS